MDVNGTRFHLRFGLRDWAPLLKRSASLVWSDGDSCVELESEIPRYSRPGLDSGLSLAQRRAAASDRYGNIFFIDDARQAVRVLPKGDLGFDYFRVEWLSNQNAEESRGGDFSPLPESITATTPRLVALAITDQHFMVVGTIDPAGLLVFDLVKGGPPQWFRWPCKTPITPSDITAIPSGGVAILDIENELGPRYYLLDRYFRVRATRDETQSVFNPAPPTGTTPAWSGDAGIGTADPFTLPIIDPIALIGLPDCSVLVLSSPINEPASRVSWVKDGVLLGQVVLQGPLLDRLVEPVLRAYTFAFLPDKRENETHRGILYLADTSGIQVFGFELAARPPRETPLGLRPALFELSLLPEVFPLRGFSGKALVVSEDTVRYHAGARFLPITAWPRIRYVRQASLRIDELDGKQPGCVWHRLLLDAYIPSDCTVEVHSRAAEDHASLQSMKWNREPALYRRREGSELGLTVTRTTESNASCTYQTWELLFQQTVGRYLELELTLRGNGRCSPRVRAVRVYYPRLSYLRRYLPEVYRLESSSAHFLERFLANFEGLLTTMEGRVESSSALFDARTAPEEFLPWLGGWLGASIDETWDEHRKRLFLQNAYLLYRRRGTRAALVAAVRLATDPCPDESVFAELKGQGNVPRRHVGREIRVVENRELRAFPAVSLGLPQGPLLPRRVPQTQIWNLQHGANQLHERFRHFVFERHAQSHESYGDLATLERVNTLWESAYGVWSEITFPPLCPDHEAIRADWRAFTRTGLGFTYAEVTADDTPAYRTFLTRIYRSFDELRAAHALPVDSGPRAFDQLELPSKLPEQEVALKDWIGFVSRTIPIAETAHRFLLLIPTEPGESEEARTRRKQAVAAVVNRERPAHTQFDVYLYWDLFQVGTARVGLDTVLGEGSRYIGIVLGTSFVGDGSLVPTHMTELSTVSPRRSLGSDATYEA